MRASRTTKRSRRGTALVLAAMLFAVMCTIIALALDIGMALVARTELQRATDAAALAGAALLVDDHRLKNGGASDLLPPREDQIRAESARFAGLNATASQSVVLDANVDNTPQGEIVIGSISNPGDLHEPLSVANPDQFNTVFVRKQLEIPVYFARAFGISVLPVETQAAATAWPGVLGFRLPQGRRLNLLPITMKQSDWDRLRHLGEGRDDFAWDEDTATVSEGQDGVREWELYPNDTTSGNFGTIDLGATNNSTNDLQRQILEGLNTDDLALFGGEIRLGPDGRLSVQGDTGISAAIKSSLAQIRGRQRIIPLYETVEGTGNTTYYTIVGFAGIRIMAVRLTGAKKALIVQTSTVVSPHAIIDPQSGVQLPDNLVYTAPRLTR